MNLGIKGKRALVFGGSAGIGFGIAKILSQEGVRVAICARDPEKLKKASRRLKAAATFSTDLYQPAEAEQITSTLVKTWRGIDILVLHNGGPPAGTFENTTFDDWKIGFNGLWLSAVESIKAVLPTMKKKKWGRIIFITSIAAKEPLEARTISNSLRAGLLGLVKSFSREVASQGITVNAVLPGYTNTESTSESALKEVKQLVPAKRFALPEEQGALVAFLASNQASYITGQAIACDGGFLRGL